MVAYEHGTLNQLVSEAKYKHLAGARERVDQVQNGHLM